MEKRKEQKAKLKIAVPNKGRLYEHTISLLRNIGLDFEIDERKLSSSVSNYSLDILYVSASNIPEYVQDGIIDIGITGLDLVSEKTADVKVIEPLQYGKANLALAVPEDSPIRSPKDLAGKKVATSFVTLTQAYFKRLKIKVDVVEVDGAVEITPLLGLVDAISDLTSSGSSLRMNKLRIIDTILESQAILISNKSVSPEKKELIDTLVMRTQSVLNAGRKKYIMLNAPESLLPKIKEVTPGLSSPTVMHLSSTGMIAVHSVIEAKDVWEVVEKLKRIGASGILIIPLEKMVV